MWNIKTILKYQLESENFLAQIFSQFFDEMIGGFEKSKWMFIIWHLNKVEQKRHLLSDFYEKFRGTPINITVQLYIKFNEMTEKYLVKFLSIFFTKVNENLKYRSKNVSYEVFLLTLKAIQLHLQSILCLTSCFFIKRIQNRLRKSH